MTASVQAAAFVPVFARLNRFNDQPQRTDEDGSKVGDYIADLIVNKELIIEIKAVKTISPAHIAQTLNYLKCTGIKEALLINFGSYKFEIKKLVL